MVRRWEKQNQVSLVYYFFVGSPWTKRESILCHFPNINTVFRNGGHAEKNWHLVMKVRRRRINKNCKWDIQRGCRVFSTATTFHPDFLRTSFWMQLRGMSSAFKCILLIYCLQSIGTRISSRKQNDFVGIWSIRTDATSRRWLQKAANMLAQTSHWDRVRKAVDYDSVKKK